MEWRYVKGFNKRYLISEEGTIIALDWKLCGKIKTIPQNENHKGYKTVSIWDGNKQVKRIVHRLVAEAFIGDVGDKLVDHIDRDKHNNHYSNLRYCTLTQSNQNRKSPKTGSRKWRGVHFHHGSFWATIKSNGITIRKRCQSEADAVLKYNKMALEEHGEFAVLNNI